MSTITFNSSIISASAFADQYAGLTAAQRANLTIVIGANVTSIEPGAFSSASASAGTLTATVSFASPATSLTIGANAFANLPVSTLSIPASTNLQANALSGINALTNLNLSAMTTSLITGSLDMTRSAVAPLSIIMPASTTVSYAPRSIVFPPSGAATVGGNQVTTTMTFSGTVPAVNSLNEMFNVPSTVSAAINVNIDYLTTSGVSATQVSTLVSRLTTAANAVPNAVHTQNSGLISLGPLNALSQFAGQYLNYVRISATECVVSGFNANFINNGLLPIASTITPTGTTSVLNVVGVASYVLINGNSENDRYYIVDNYHHAPYYASNPTTAAPLFALIKSNGFSAAEVAPTLVCNGSYAFSDAGHLVITASSAAYAQGHTSPSSGLVSVLNMNAALHNIASSATIGKISSTATSFEITLNTLSTSTDNAVKDYIQGAFQKLPNLQRVDFKNQSDSDLAAWNAFSSASSAAIADNSALVGLLAQISTTPITITQQNPVIAFPSAAQSISGELTALSTSNANAVKTSLAVLSAKHAGAYATYLDSVNTYIGQVVANSAVTDPFQHATNSQFVLFQTSFNQLRTALSASVAALTAAVNAYFQSRFQLGNNAFKSCSAISALSNFESLRCLIKINPSAFHGCAGIVQSLNIPIGVETIGESAFRACTGLTGLVLQDSLALRTIEAYAFYACSALAGSLSFSSAMYHAQSVETIGDYAFSNCTLLTDHLYFPPNMQSLGVGAFKGCTRLNGTIVLPQNQLFTAIPESAFEGCTGLTGVSNNTGNGTTLTYLPGTPNYVSGTANAIPNGLNIPSNVQVIGLNAFKGCAAFAGALNLSPAGVALRAVGESAFQGCSGFTSLNLPVNSEFTAISPNCFFGCTGLTTVVIPGNVVSIMEGAFRGCSNIADQLSIAHVQRIYNDAFNGCSKLSGALILGTNLAVIGDRAFYGCSRLTSATFLGIPPANIQSAVAVFGLDASAPNAAKFYVNVFPDNGWVPINAQGSPLSINSVFRAHDPTAQSTKSRVVLSYIDFTFKALPTATSRSLTMTKCDPATFLLWDNSGTSGANVQIDSGNTGVKEWYDVCMPGLLKGFDLASAQDAASTLTNQLVLLVEYIAAAMEQPVAQYADNTFNSALQAGLAFNGKNLLINAGPSGSGIDLVSLAAFNSNAPANNSYGVSSTGSGASQVDTLSFGATSGAASAKLLSTGAHIQYYISGSTGSAPLNTKYAKKIINVDSLGVISIAPVTVIESVATSAADPAATATGYTIQSTSSTLFLNDLVAPAGAYYIATGSGANPATAYLRKIIYVNSNSAITLPDNELAITGVVAVANLTTTPSVTLNTYSVVALNGAGNTGHVFKVGNGSAAVSPQQGTYYIKSSDVLILNNAIVQVDHAGAISLNSHSLSGMANSLVGLTNALVGDGNAGSFGDPISILTTDAQFVNYNGCVTGEYAVSTSLSKKAMDSLTLQNDRLNVRMTALNATVTNVTNALALPASLKTAVANARANQVLANTAITALQTTFSGAYTGAKNSFDSANATLGAIQTSSLALVNTFIQNSVYDALPLNGAAPPVANNLAYVTGRVEFYMNKYLTYQQSNSSTAYTTVVSQVNSAMGYANFTRVEKNLADEAAFLINTLATAAAGSANANSWTSLTTAPLPAISNFISVVVTANTSSGISPYSKFVTDHPVPTVAQVKLAIAAYESSMQTAGANNGVAAAAATAAAAAYAAAAPAYPAATVHDKADVSVAAAAVYGYYYPSSGAYTNFKSYLRGLVAAFVAQVVAISAQLVAVESALIVNAGTVTALHAELNAAILATNAGITAASNVSNKHLNASQVRTRMLALYKGVLLDRIGTPGAAPALATAPAYEKEWFKQRVDHYCHASATAAPTVSSATTAYQTAATALIAAKTTLQGALIDSYFANSPPTQDVVSVSGGVPQALVRENVFNCLSNITTFIPASASGSLPTFVSSVSTTFVNYIIARDAAIAGILDPAAKAAAILTFQQQKIVDANANLYNANIGYGIALFNQYMALIDLAIVDLMVATGVADATAFQNNMHKYNSPKYGHSSSEYLPALQATLFQQVYASSVVPPSSSYALVLSTATGILTQYNIFEVSWNNVNGMTNLTTVPITSFGSTSGNTPATITITQQQYAGKLTAYLVTSGIDAAVESIAAEYTIVALGETVTAVTQGPLTIVGGLYTVSIGGWAYYGYEQSSLLNNSLSLLSANETAVFLYKGTGTNGVVQPAGLLQLTAQTNSNNNFFCDNAEYVIFIKPDPVNAGGKTFSVYSYCPYSVTSGSLKFVGTISKAGTIVMNTVAGCFQPQVGMASVKLTGSLTLSNSINTVGISAFADCVSLKSVTFASGASPVAVSANAFANCTGLTAINLGSTVASVGSSAFFNCSGATSLTLSTNLACTVLDHFAFLGCVNASNNLVLPSNLAQVNVQSFARCNKLLCSQLNGAGAGAALLPANFKKIGFGAFESCSSLTGALNLNNLVVNGAYVSSVNFIGSMAFFGCHGLNGALSLPINAAYVNVMPYTFASMAAPFAVSPVSAAPNATAMQLQGSLNFSDLSVATIGVSAFYKCAALSELKLSSKISDIGVNAFRLCTGLSGALVLPAFVKTVGDSAFEGCSALAGLTIVSTTVSESAVTPWLSIGASAFKNCALLTNSGSSAGIVIPNTVSRLGDSAFSGCANMPSVTVGSGLTAANSFGKGMFVGCTKLARVTLTFSFLSRTGVGNVVSGSADNTNLSFTDCPALGLTTPTQVPSGSIGIQSGATGWNSGRAAFFNYLTVVVNNKNITFYLNEFNAKANMTVVTPSEESVLNVGLPVTDAQATVHVKASDLRKVFSTSTDSYVNNNGTTQVDQSQMFYVSPEYFPKYLNVANARVVQGGIEAYNSALYEQLVKDDVMRYYAMSLFQSADWVTLFANDVEMLENMVASAGLMPIVPDGDVVAGTNQNAVNTGVLSNIMQDLNNIAYTTTNAVNARMVQSANYPVGSANKWWGLPDTVLPEQGNICKKLFSLIQRMDPARITSMASSGSTPMELPFLAGDQFVFVFTLNAKEVKLSLNADSVPIKARTYLIKMVLTEDFVSGSSAFAEHNAALYGKSSLNQNVIPMGSAYVADYMYSNYDLKLAVPQAQSSALTATTASVYSKVTNNYAYEPIPTPSNLLPFAGWYYSHTTNSQSLQLDFTPSTPDLTYHDLRYLSAYMYFPDMWSSMSVLPSPQNFPTWNVTFSNGANSIKISYPVKFLGANGDVVSFFGKTAAFDYGNTHIQLLASFDASTTSMPNGGFAAFNSLLNGTNTAGVAGVANTITGTYIWHQGSTSVAVVNGLHSPNEASGIGPYTYPPVARGYQCIPMPTDNGIGGPEMRVGQPNTNYAVVQPGNAYKISKITLDINMAQSSGFVPSVIIKSVEVVAKNYEAYYLAPLNPNP